MAKSKKKPVEEKKVLKDRDWRKVYYKTGIYQIDGLYGGYGIPAGSMTEFTSDAGIGKTTITLEICKSLMEKDPEFRVLYIDAEDGLNYDLLDSVGITPYMGKIEDGDQFEVVYWDTHAEVDAMLFREKKESTDGKYRACREEEKGYIVRFGSKISLIIIDSITAVLPKAGYDKGIESLRPGMKAQMDSSFILKFRNIVRKRHGIASIWINQQRFKLNFGGITRLASAGGKAFEFYMDVRLTMRQVNKIMKVKHTINGDEDIKIGSYNSIHAFKNKYTNMGIAYQVPLIFGKGISTVLGLKPVLLTSGLVKQSGAWYVTSLLSDGDDTVKMNGEKAFIEWIKSNLPQLKVVVDNWLTDFWAEIKRKELITKKSRDEGAYNEGELVMEAPDPVEVDVEVSND